MTSDQVIWECFRHFVHLDHSNAAVHCAPVRYSPITFRLAELLAEMGVTDDHLAPLNIPILKDVLQHRGQYAEDGGR